MLIWARVRLGIGNEFQNGLGRDRRIHLHHGRLVTSQCDFGAPSAREFEVETGSIRAASTDRSNSITERRTIRFVSVPQQIARRSVPGKGLGDLAGEPDLRGILGDLEVNNPSAVEAEHNQGIEEPERRGGNHKHVDRRNVGQVVAE